MCLLGWQTNGDHTQIMYICILTVLYACFGKAGVNV